MKILVIGCGSIGRRHASNVVKLGHKVVLCDLNEMMMRKFGSTIQVSEYYIDFNLAIKKSNVSAAIIATPSGFHFDPAKACNEAKIPMLMEKPLCTSLKEGIDLLNIVNESGVMLMMGHTYRFRDDWIAIKKYIDEVPLGCIYSVEIAGGWYLPDWHIFEDFKKEYAAQKKLGGGVLLTGMSHIFDIVNWIFGSINNLIGVKSQLGQFDIDVEDSVVCILKTASGVSVTLIEDFLSRVPRRQLRVNAEYGYFEADFIQKSLKVWDSRKKRFHPNDLIEKQSEVSLFRVLEDGVAYNLKPDVSTLLTSSIGNDAYLNEMKAFIEIVMSKNKKIDLDITCGIQVLNAIFHEGIQKW